MADLSAYVDFTFKIDLSGTTPVCVVTDISSYPTGVPAAFSGFLSITQPDGVNLTPNFSVPDIIGSALSATKSYRPSVNGLTQNGTYVITYTVKCAGYTDTVKVKTFKLNYKNPVPLIIPNIDAFSPQIKVGDGTNFIQSGFTLSAQTRLWNVTIYYVGSSQQVITDSASLLDLIYSAAYYDARYYAILTNTFTYTSTDYAWVSVVNKLITFKQFDVYTPMSLSALQTALDALGVVSSNGTCGCSKTNNDFILAQSLLNQIISRGQQGDTVGLDQYEQRLERIFFPFANRQHTNIAIAAYSFGNSTNNEITLPAGTTSYIVAGGTFLNAIVWISGVATSVCVGTTPGGNDVYDYTSVNLIGTHREDKYFQSNTTIYFTGILASTVTKIYKR